MFTLVGIGIGAVAIGIVISYIADLLPRSRTRDQIERFHCESGIPGEMRDRDPEC